VPLTLVGLLPTNVGWNSSCAYLSMQMLAHNSKPWPNGQGLLLYWEMRGLELALFSCLDQLALAAQVQNAVEVAV
jgi:hypothetical protein